jgi:hypothetical protein
MGSAASVCLAVQPVFASTRSVLSGASSRIMRRISSSRAEPTLTLSTGYDAASRTLSRMVSSSSMPRVNEESGAAAGSSPHSFHTGTPSRFPTRSCSAAEIATLAAGFRPIAAASAASIRSSAKGSPSATRSSAAPITGSTAATVSAVSP